MHFFWSIFTHFTQIFLFGFWKNPWDPSKVPRIVSIFANKSSPEHIANSIPEAWSVNKNITVLKHLQNQNILLYILNIHILHRHTWYIHYILIYYIICIDIDILYRYYIIYYRLYTYIYYIIYIYIIYIIYMCVSCGSGQGVFACAPLRRWCHRQANCCFFLFPVRSLPTNVGNSNSM